MASPEKWICNGIPKNQKLAAGAGEVHPPHENYSTDCEICGLPREAQIEPSKPLPAKAILIAISGLLILGGSGAAYTFVSQGCKARLEKVAGKCIDPFLQPYQTAIQQGDEAILLAKGYKSITDLEKAQLSLDDAIKQLEFIPTEALLYSEAAIKLIEYSKNKTAISTNLGSEKIALSKLQESEKTAKEAKSQTSGDRTTAELKSAREKWSKAKAILQEINSYSLVITQVEEYHTNYDREIQGINRRIAAMAKSVPPPRSPNTYKAPKKTYTPVKKKRYFPPKRKTVNTDSCAVKKSSNCLF